MYFVCIVLRIFCLEEGEGFFCFSFPLFSFSSFLPTLIVGEVGKKRGCFFSSRLCCGVFIEKKCEKKILRVTNTQKERGGTMVLVRILTVQGASRVLSQRRYCNNNLPAASPWKVCFLLHSFSFFFFFRIGEVREA